MSVLALSASSAYSGCLQYSQNEASKSYSVPSIMRIVGEMNLRFNSISNSTYEEISNSFYMQKNNRYIIVEENDMVEDVQLKSFVKSSTKVRVKVNKVNKLGITV